ncbi:large ribosomal subunit protein uL24m [Monosporozyma servazzii]
MSFNYRHISKAGSRILERVNNPVAKFAKGKEKQRIQSIPEFMRPDLPLVDEAKKFKTEQDWKFLPGDRVVIVRGEHRGNVCMIKGRDEHTNGYLLDDNGPSKQVVVPKEYWQEGQTSHVVAVPKTMTQKDLRLVADIEDEMNPDQVKTVAVQNVVFKGTYYDEDYKKVLPYRCVLGQTDLVIPWPRPEPVEDGNLATNPEVSREQTYWVDSVARNPIPKKAFMTIRNPRSKYRRGKISAKDLKFLVKPEMPMTESQKAALAMKEQLGEIQRPELTEEDKILISERVKSYLDKQAEAGPTA